MNKDDANYEQTIRVYLDSRWTCFRFLIIIIIIDNIVIITSREEGQGEGMRDTKTLKFIYTLTKYSVCT